MQWCYNTIQRSPWRKSLAGSALVLQEPRLVFRISDSRDACASRATARLAIPDTDGQEGGIRPLPDMRCDQSSPRSGPIFRETMPSSYPSLLPLLLLLPRTTLPRRRCRGRLPLHFHPLTLRQLYP